MVFVLCTTSFFSVGVHAADSTDEYDSYPLIVVRGFDIVGFAYADGTEILEIDIPEIIGVAFQFLLEKLFFMEDKAIDTLLGYASKLFEPISSNFDGLPNFEDVHIPQFLSSTANFDLSIFGERHAWGLIREAADQLGSENVYVFTFDWRKSPEVYARELDNLIEIAKEETGKDKVNIAATSMGGVVLAAYFNYVGYDKINSSVVLSGVQNGADFAGNLFVGNIEIKKENIINFLNSLTADQGFFVKALLKTAEIIGVYDLLTNIFNDVLVKNKDRVYNEFLRNTLATSPGLWALCPDEQFDEGLEYVFGGREEKYAGAIEKIKGIKDFVCSTEDIFDKAYDEGVNLTFVSNYGFGLVPIYKGCEAQGDVVVSTYVTSNFATAAPLGKQLSDEELAGVAPEYISPDRSVNASTCLFPEYTWFVKNALHVGCSYNSEFARFAIMLATSETQPTVYDSELYPRFLEVDSNQNFIR